MKTSVDAGSRPPWRVAAVQLKFARTIDANLDKIEARAGEAARQGADVVLFPECATTGYTFDFASLNPCEIDSAVDRISTTARKNRINILVGTPLHRLGQWQNCLVAFDRTGTCVHRYAKCHLAPVDRQFFSPGNDISLFELDGVKVTSIICHERRYPELVRLAVMAGARVLFHPNAGMDSLEVSTAKRKGRDGIAIRAFENAIFYVFANSVGPQGGGKWSAGDSKIVAPDGRNLALANNRDETVISANLDLTLATRKYALEGMEHPAFLSRPLKSLINTLKTRAERANRSLQQKAS
jgi:predicted amidohydrolase